MLLSCIDVAFVGTDMDIDQPAWLWRDTGTPPDRGRHERQVANGPLFVMAAGYLALQPPHRSDFHVRTKYGEIDQAGIAEVVQAWRTRLLQ